MLPTEASLMNRNEQYPSIIEPHEPILITGAAGFIGYAVVESLLRRGFLNLRCFTRSFAGGAKLKALSARYPDAAIEIVQGNLLSREDCIAAANGAAVVIHLAAGRGEKLVPDAYLNSVVTTRNLLEACIKQQGVRRFVNVSSFTVYTNCGKQSWRTLDESCPVENHPELRGDAYTFAKVKQDEIVERYGQQYGIPCVLVRPGFVYGPGGKAALTGRVGTGAFGLFLHLGGSTKIPLSYLDNCADAIALTAVVPGIDGEVFNVVDGGLPSSRKFLRLYKKNVKRFKSIYVPKPVSFLLCYVWERYSNWSEGQLPLAFNRKSWHAFWKTTRYSNEKLRKRLGWSQCVPTEEGMRRYFEACRTGGVNA